ncbi:IclR family transcriptional regulator [Cellulomonas fengjieae]|uniref:Helix-turn-helix domain-containing protein n=1 Tax=Cellulomonas fengjieae TaxID=2819978 RepID=A0ABS3SJL7_9CELL|nr:helix-turn-helix domain-containing protein [Cellulomonas fengjieae]MBO3085945.1 helix-turn-helix domain-containing protein [Cellulomonas fengjieae]QVI65983.1 helix-turn-helix domain-containing protein [Cellulomonas fengjieae]
MLTTGLDILRIVAEAEAPLTATAIAQRVGLHVSSVSRTLAVLVRHGYLRKPTYHSFAADLGVLALAGQAVTRLPAVARTRPAIEALARETGMQATLAALHHDEVLYLHRSQAAETITGVAGGFPLHLSVVGLRLLLDVPAAEATAALERAERRYGWERPTPATPANPAECLAQAGRRLRDGMLRIDAWDAPGILGVAVRVDVAGHAPLAVALVGPMPDDADAFARTHLDRGAAAVRTALEEQM